MNDIIFRKVTKKGYDHLTYCEDDSYYCEYDSNIQFFGIFDGCSSAIKSHFASSLFAKIFKSAISERKKYIIDDTIDNELLLRKIFVRFYEKLSKIVNELQLSELEIASTFIVGVRRNSSINIIVSGDGCIMIDGKETKIESPDNAPNYIAYHVCPDNDGFDIIDVYEKQVSKYNFDDFNKSLSICSDGIYSYKNVNNPDAVKYMVDYMLIDDKFINSDSMLSRKYNIAVKDGYINTDDLSIIRLIKNS